MATYVLIHGGAADAWYWGPLAAELHGRGHDVVAPDLPCDDESAGLAEYADAVVEAIGARTGLVVVAHSFGGFTAPLVCERVPVELLVLVQAQVPAPGEAPGQWWENTGYPAARQADDRRRGVPEGAAQDPVAFFLHDTPAELAAELLTEHQRAQSATPFGAPWPLSAWPQVPTRFLLARDDRFFPADFLRRTVVDRLGFEPDEMPGDHLPMLGHPQELADRLEAYRAAL
ncbi:alpha/beta fold hydrolase [Kitasatospora viridis]|uniref:Alpha/beta hydrolase family protein n=1 Tax=Kitasatospora viridis TaxID=281105 RepID=A0A561SDN1_9ACTN|nr:alpha/beta hydrolase [Kitasatospora viridis]TWF72976.1 alpha/beta hydrolase family protein [Kitasatospora viridis]